MKRLLLVFYLLILATGCTKTAAPSVNDIELTSSPSSGDIVIGFFEERRPYAECKDFRFICSDTVPVTAADLANGTEERECVAISFVFQSQPGGEWKDMSVGKPVVRDGSGQHIEMGSDGSHIVCWPDCAR